MFLLIIGYILPNHLDWNISLILRKAAPRSTPPPFPPFPLAQKLDTSNPLSERSALSDQRVPVVGWRNEPNEEERETSEFSRGKKWHRSRTISRPANAFPECGRPSEIAIWRIVDRARFGSFRNNNDTRGSERWQEKRDGEKGPGRGNAPHPRLNAVLMQRLKGRRSSRLFLHSKRCFLFARTHFSSAALFIEKSGHARFSDHTRSGFGRGWDFSGLDTFFFSSF